VQGAVTAALAQARRQQQRLAAAGSASAALTPEASTVLSTLEFYGKPPVVTEDDNPNQPPTAQKLQKLLSSDLHEVLRQELKANLSDVQREMLSNFDSPHASAWLLARADEPQTTLSDLEFSIAMRSRLMLRPVRSAHPVAKCPAPCNADISNDASNHSLGCSGLRASWTIRHNMVAEPISRIFRMAGCVTQWVPLVGFGQCRGDLIVTPSGRGEHGGASLMLDFTFGHSLNATRVKQHHYNNSVKHTLESLESAKIKAYQRGGLVPGWTFYPMAGTALGAIGEKAVDCLRLLPKLVPEKDKDFGEKLCRKAFVWWSVALQRGNAVVHLNGVYRSNLANRQELGQGRPRRGPGR
jgi:hypothetical protein